MPVVLKIPHVQARPGRRVSRWLGVGRGVCQHLALLGHLPEEQGIELGLIDAELSEHLIVEVEGGG